LIWTPCGSSAHFLYRKSFDRSIAVVVMLLVTTVFANNFLNARMVENEFSAVKQFMQTVGLQIDDVAWIQGRTQTIRYASKCGQLKLESVALNYTV